MSGNAPSLSAKKPESVLKRHLSLDVKGLASALVKGVGHVVLGKFDDLTDDGADALVAIGLEGNKPEALLFLLLQRSMQSALAALLQDGSEHLPDEISPDSLLPHLEAAISSVEVDSDFFLHPTQLPMLQSVVLAVEEWLTNAGTDPAVAETISQRLPGFFPYALHREWQLNGKRYEVIQQLLNTPFAQAAEREAAWQVYSARLQQVLEEGVFSEPFGLRQIYIPLNAYFEEDTPKSEPADEPRRKKLRVVVELQKELDEWLSKNDRGDAIRVVSGGPGCGKSSFAKIYAAHVAAQGRLKVLFVPLHHIDPTRDFSDEIGRFIRDQGLLKYNPLDTDARDADLLIILDGLDELASQGRAAAATARDFVRAVQQTVDRRNLPGLQLRVLFSGREVVIQESESEFRRPRQVLTVLPYFVAVSPNRRRLFGLRGSEDYRDPHKLLERDLRQAWWENYGRLTGHGYSGLPEELDRDDLLEITAQPLLNYLLALSFCRNKLDFTAGVNLNQIYHDLVEAVYERGYEQGRRAVRELHSKDFFLILEEIGLAAWHGDGRTTTVAEIEQHCRDGGFGSQLDVFQDGAKRGITRLLAAFFFRQQGVRPKGDATFVFTHKSFGEYLAARRMVRAMRDVADELQRRETKGGVTGWSEKDALHYWAKWCGPTAISPFIHQFLVAEVALAPKSDVDTWQQHFTRLFSYMLSQGMPMEKLQLSTFQEALFQSRNSEEALLAALNACATATQKMSKIEYPSPNAFGTWFKRNQGQRMGPESALAAYCLTWLNLSELSLDFSDFYGANLSNTDLQHFDGYEISLDSASLRNAELSRARLMRASLVGADLSGANLSKAILVDADLSRVDLSGANLREANLIGADLSRSDLSGADLSGADLSGANFIGATILDTNFENTIMKKARFSKGQRPQSAVNPKARS